MRKSQNITSCAFYVALLTLWEYSGSKFVPPPTQILQTFWGILPLIFGDLSITLAEASIGLVLGVAMSIVIVSLMHVTSPLETIFTPLIVLSQALPFNIIAPILVLIFGFGIESKIFVVFLVCFFPICLNLLTAFRNVPKELVESGQLFGANSWQLLYYLKYPLSFSPFLAGVKISSVYCISSAIIAEWMAGDSGLGAYILRAKRSYANDKVFACILLIVLLGLLSYYLLDIVHKKVEKW